MLSHTTRTNIDFIVYNSYIQFPETFSVLCNTKKNPTHTLCKNQKETLLPEPEKPKQLTIGKGQLPEPKPVESVPTLKPTIITPEEVYIS